ncbi:MAG: MATE family efflux transporter [Azospirillaceae bacterium]
MAESMAGIHDRGVTTAPDTTAPGGRLKPLVRLAIPVVVARSGLMGMASVDLLMVGHYGAEALAWVSLGSMAAGPLIGVLVGLLMGTMVSTSLAIGEGRRTEAGAVWRRSVPYGLVLGAAMAAGCVFGPALFLATGQPPDLAEGGGRVLAILGVGLPGVALYITSAFWLEAIGRPRSGMVLMIVGNLVNVPLNWVLVYGALGVPEMGAEGSAWATTGMRWIMGLALLAMIWWLPGREALRVREKAGGRWRDWAAQRRQGFAAAVSIGAESISFSILAMMAGWISIAAVGAYAIAINLQAVVFMVALGLASATAVQVGTAWGARDRAAASAAGWLGLALNSAVMGGLGLVMALFPESLAGIFTGEPSVLPLAAAMIFIGAFATVLDGGQTVMAHAVRGTGDTWVPSALQTVVYVGIMPAIAWGLAFGLERGATGLMESIVLASALALAGQAARFAWLARRRAGPRAALPPAGG